MSKLLRTDQIRHLLPRYERLFEDMGLTVNPRTQKRLDANDTAFLVRQVELVRSRVLEVKHAELLARRFIPTATDIPSWASHVVQIVYDDAGQAKVIANGADDLPQVDVVADEKTFTVVSLGASYSFTVQDLRQSLATGVGLPDKKSRTAARVINTAIDEMLATGKLTSAGQTSLGMVGFLNSSAVPTITLTTDGFYKAATTGDQMLEDLNKVYRAPSIATKQIFAADTLILGLGIFHIVNTKVRASGTDTTVLEAFKAQHPEAKIEIWHRMDIFVDATHDLIMAYKRDPEVVEGIVPQEFEQFPPQFVNLVTKVNVHARCGGCRFWHPKGAAYASASTATS